MRPRVILIIMFPALYKNIQYGGITPDFWPIKVHTSIPFESTKSRLSFEMTLDQTKQAKQTHQPTKPTRTIQCNATHPRDTQDPSSQLWSCGDFLAVSQ